MLNEMLAIRMKKGYRRRLRAEAKAIGKKEGTLAREVLEQWVETRRTTSCHEAMKPACGHFSGSKNASVKEGFDD